MPLYGHLICITHTGRNYWQDILHSSPGNIQHTWIKCFTYGPKTMFNLFTTSSVFYISLPVTYCCWMKWYTSYHGVHRKPPAPLDIRVELRARTGRSPTPAWGLCSVSEPAAGPRGGPPWPPPTSRPATDGGGVSADRCPFRWPWRREPRPRKPGWSWGPCRPAAGGRTLVQTRQQRQTHTDGELLGTMRANLNTVDWLLRLLHIVVGN